MAGCHLQNLTYRLIVPYMKECMHVEQLKASLIVNYSAEYTHARLTSQRIRLRATVCVSTRKQNCEDHTTRM